MTKIGHNNPFLFTVYSTVAEKGHSKHANSKFVFLKWWFPEWHFQNWDFQIFHFQNDDFQNAPIFLLWGTSSPQRHDCICINALSVLTLCWPRSMPTNAAHVAARAKRSFAERSQRSVCCPLIFGFRFPSDNTVSKMEISKMRISKTYILKMDIMCISMRAFIGTTRSPYGVGSDFLPSALHVRLMSRGSIVLRKYWYHLIIKYVFY